MRSSPRERQFDDIIKSGRTHLQDATPDPPRPGVHRLRTHGARHRQKLAQAADWLREMNIGGTAVGTGINAEPEYPGLMVQYLHEVSGLELREGGGSHPAHAVAWATSRP